LYCITQFGDYEYMIRRSAPARTSHGKAIQQCLAALYARHAEITLAIRNLETYRRARTKRTARRLRKVA